MTEVGQKYLDLYFLDVEMEDQANGIELAHRIRICYQEPVIVYVTNHLECAPEAFEVNAFRFIPKRMRTDKLSNMLDHALAVWNGIGCVHCNDTFDEYHIAAMSVRCAIFDYA